MKNQGKTKVICDDLQDLALAGVKWELNDIPMTVVEKIIANNKQILSEDSAASESNTVARTPTSIVPPIAPAMPISVETAAAMAVRPTDMQALNRMIAEFNHPLRGGATNSVLPHIAANPNGLLIITDIPSGEDDACGKILSGPAGELLDKMLQAIGMSRNEVYITPLVFWRTPGGRTPNRNELDLAKPFVNKFIELAKPSFILTLGTLAANEIAGINLSKGHGEVVTLDNGVRCVPIFHPNYLILKPTAKRDAWNALQTVQKLLKSSQE